MPIADVGRYRNLVFTWNNFPEEWQALLESRLPPTRYLVVGSETAPSTGTPHLQGYVEFRSAARGTTLKSSFPNVWFDPRRGSAQEAADYCKKELCVLETGEISSQGKRTDIENVRESLLAGDTNIRDVVLNASSMQSIRFAETYMRYHEPKRTWRPKVYWFYGLPGSGKTALAVALAKRHDLDLHIQRENAKWWDGYDAHKAVLIDDIRSSFCSFTRILDILDRYSCRIECKGGSRELLATHMFVTSPSPPATIWSTDENYLQLSRRIDHIWEIKCCDTIDTHIGPDADAIISNEEWFPTEAQDDSSDDTEPASGQYRC